MMAAPIKVLDLAISEASDQALVTTFAALTHRLHTLRNAENEPIVRAQRDQVEAEILRRMAS